MMNKNLPRSILAALVALSAVGCESLVEVKLNLVEPCNQRNQALNGVGGLRVTLDGFALPVTQELSVSQNADAIEAFGTAEAAQVTVQGFSGDPNTDGATIFTADPKSVGRTVPFAVRADTQDIDVNLVMGLRDGVAEATNDEGACQAMDTGAQVPGRHGHSATFIPEIGKVLITGGAVWVSEDDRDGEALLKSAELFDPATGTFEFVGDMPTTRAYHTATYIGNGRVLIAGGLGVIGGAVVALKAAVVYDVNLPIDAPFENVDPMVNQRAFHTATFLEDNEQVVFVGGCQPDSDANAPVDTCTPQSMARTRGGADPTGPQILDTPIEIFDVEQNRFVSVGEGLLEPRALHGASALGGNRLLVSGGVNSSGPVCSVEIFESNGLALTRIDAGSIGVAQFNQGCPIGHAQVSLNASRVAFIGGRTNAPSGVIGGPLHDQVIFWNTLVGIEASPLQMQTGRFKPAAATLDDESVIIIGGEVAAGEATAERIIPDPEADPLDQQPRYLNVPLEGPPPLASLLFSAGVLLPNNQFFVVGGHTADRVTSERAFVYVGD